jgi:hypothetical protein
MSGIWHSEWVVKQAVVLFSIVFPVFCLLLSLPKISNFTAIDSALTAVSVVAASLSFGYVCLFFMFRQKFKLIELPIVLAGLFYVSKIGDFSAPLTAFEMLSAGLSLFVISLYIFKGPRFA